MYKVTKTGPATLMAIILIAITTVMGLPSALSATLNKAVAIKIKADYMAFDLKTGRNLYEGNVSIIQGSIELTGDKVTILRSNNKVSDIKVTGNPARYLQDENTRNIVRAMSQQIHYSAESSRLVLTDEASLEQSDHTVESQRIVYDTAKKMIIAGKISTEKDGSKQRVHITLTPSKDNHRGSQKK